MNTLFSIVILGAVARYYISGIYWKWPFKEVRNKKRHTLHKWLMLGLAFLWLNIFYPELIDTYVRFPIWANRIVSTILILSLSFVYQYRSYAKTEVEHNSSLSWLVITILTLYLAKMLHLAGMLAHMNSIIAWCLALWLAFWIQIMVNGETFMFGEDTKKHWGS